MATDTVDGMSGHLRGVTVTVVAAFSGVAAAFASDILTDGVATDPLGLVVVGAFILAELPLLRLFGVDVDDFSTKDNLYVAFMTFALWFVSWGILLTAESL